MMKKKLVTFADLYRNFRNLFLDLNMRLIIPTLYGCSIRQVEPRRKKPIGS